MPSENNQFETPSEIDSPDPQFQFFDGLEDCDFEFLSMPSLSPLRKMIQANSPPVVRLTPSPVLHSRSTPSSIAVVQPPDLEPQLRPTPSPVTVRRRSSSRSNVSIVAITWENTNGRKKSLEFVYDSGNPMDYLFQSVAPADLQSNQHVSIPLDSQVATISPRLVSQSQIQIDTQSLTASLQPQMAVDPQMPHLTLTASYTPPATQSTQLQPQISPRRTRQPPSAGHFQPPLPSLPHQGHGGRQPPPPEIQAFLNPHHIPRNHGRVPDKRGLKDTTVANFYYYSISQLPEFWLPISRKMVSYSGVEFEPNLRFTANEFLEYLDDLPHGPGHTPRRRPILRIQIQPAQYNHRYIRGGESFKCRMADCPDKRGTILKGQARVCIQEFSDEHGDWLNPYHNAGYMHLFCLESQVDLIALYRDRRGVRILPEDRKLEHEPPSTTNPRTNNPMALNDLERGVVNDWLQEIGSRWEVFQGQYPDPRTRPRFVLQEQDQLYHRLTKAHLQNKATQTIQKKRKLEARGRVTAHLDEFVGNVSRHAAMRQRMVAQQRQGQSVLPLANRSVPSPDAPTSKRRRIVIPPPAHEGGLVQQDLLPIGAQAPLGYSGSVDRHNITPPPQDLYYTPVGRCPGPDPKADGLPRGFSPLSYEERLYLSRLGPGAPLTAEALARLPPQPQTAWPALPADIDDPAFFQLDSQHVGRSPPRATATAAVDFRTSPRPDYHGNHNHNHSRGRSRRRRCPSLVLVASAGVDRRRSSGRSRRASKLASNTSAELIAALAGWLEAQDQGEADAEGEPGPDASGDGGRIEEIE